MPQITMLYAGFLGVLSIGLSALAGTMRGRLNVSVGDGGNAELTLAMRRHANFVEYVPMALILIALLEMRGVSATAIHILAGSLLAARLCHAVGLKADTIAGIGRLVGAAGTALVTVVASIWCVVAFYQG